MTDKVVREDFKVIASFVPNNAKVLDVGCDTGELLNYLRSEKNAETRGLELSMDGVSQCLANGHSVVQGNANKDLQFYPSKSFDVVLLSKTLQATTAPHKTLTEITRIGKKAIVGFSNFGHINVIWDIMANSRMPVTKSLPLSWYETPNIHFCTIRDFVNLCNDLNLNIESYVIANKNGKKINANPKSLRANLFGAEAVFVISEK